MIGWGGETTPLCVMRCMRLAECEIDGEPHCIQCADEHIERFVLMDIRPELANVLPALRYGAER